MNKYIKSKCVISFHGNLFSIIAFLILFYFSLICNGFTQAYLVNLAVTILLISIICRVPR